MNWTIFWMFISIIMMIGGTIWYSEMQESNEPIASLTIIIGAVIMAIVAGMAI